VDKQRQIVLVVAIGTRERFYEAVERREPSGGWESMLT